jgi:sodium transport system permease protein
MNEYLSNGRLWRLCQKELRESLRDRRTIVTLVLMPILVYPLLSMALQRLIIGNATKAEAESAYVIGTQDEQTAIKVRDLLSDLEEVQQSGTTSPIKVLRSDEKKKNTPLEKSDPTDAADSVGPSTPAKVGFNIVIVERISLTKALSDSQVDLAVSQLDVAETEVRRGKAISYQLQVDFRQGDLRSETAISDFRKAMQLINDHQAELLLKRIDERLSPMVRMNANGIGSPVDPTTSIVGVIPLVLILMTITGAVYPAIDLTAGERERGTMEALIATPAPRFALLLSKYVAVVSVAILTALANLFATWITLSFGGLGQAIFGKNGFSIWILVQILPLLAIFAAFFSAILLALCSFARSFKEAQAYLIPVMLISLGPGLVTLMPNVEFTTLLGIVPLVNILLLSRDIMTGQSSLVPAFAAVFSTIIYAGATLVVASRLFGAEAATSGSQESWSELLGRPKKLRLSPTLGELAIFLAALFPIFFVMSNVGGMLELRGAVAMFFNAVLLLVLFMLLPLAYAWYRRLDTTHTFRLRLFGNPGEAASIQNLRSLGYFVSVILLSAGLWMVAFEAYLMFENWSLASQLSEEERTKLKETFLDIPFWIILLTGAVAPAIAEEFFFRGFVLSAFTTKLTPSRSVLFTALLFGFFHVIAGNILSLEKFLPTMILGVSVGYVAIKSNSLWPGILLHALHNALVFGMSRISESELAKWFGTDTKHLPVAWLVGGAVCIVLGFTLLHVASRQKQVYENVA